jgi:hypothetical protein
MRLALSLVMAAITFFAGGWVYAKYELLGRVTELSRRSTELCNRRGTGTLDRDAVLGQFEALADSVHLEVLQAEMSVEPVGNSGTGEGMGAAMQNVLSGMSAGKVAIKANMVKVNAHVRGEKWLWSVDRTVEPSCVLVGRVELREDRQVRDAAGESRDSSRSLVDGR